MSTAFDASAIEQHGWRQGAVLGVSLAADVRKLAPNGIAFADSDWLIVTSHDCDVLNGKLEKEPTVEVLRAAVVQQKKPDKQQVWGRNPREMQLAVSDGAGGEVVLAVKVHERWSMPRELLALEAPRCVLDGKPRRLIAEWLAKRYIRAAFPTAFDARWRSKMRDSQAAARSSPKYASAAQPTASVSAAAVDALIALPQPGTHPTSHWLMPRPTCVAVNVSRRSAAAALVIVAPVLVGDGDDHRRLDARQHRRVRAGELREAGANGGGGGGGGVNDSVDLLVRREGGALGCSRHLFACQSAV
jgi:hypothetical protein